MERVPPWRGAADAWFKLLAAIAIGYLILVRAVAVVKSFAGVSVIVTGAVLLAYFVYPAVAWLNRRLPLWAALAIVYVAGASAITIATYTLAPAAVTQIQGLIRDFPTIEQWVLAVFHGTGSPFFAHLPSVAQRWIEKLPSQAAADVQEHASSYAASLINAAKVLLSIGAFAIAIPVISIYMLAEAATIKQSFVGAFRPRWRPKVVSLLRDIDAVIGGFIRGQIIVAAVVGMLAIVALTILHIPYALIIGIWAGLMDVIPYIGPFAGAIPAVVLALVYNGWGDALGAIAAFTLINQLEAHLLGPRIVSTTVKVSPLTVILGS